MSDVAYLAGWPSFLILLGGILLAAGYIPLRNLVMQAGYPGWHGLMTAAVVTVNFLGNLTMVGYGRRRSGYGLVFSQRSSPAQIFLSALTGGVALSALPSLMLVGMMSTGRHPAC